MDDKYPRKAIFQHRLIRKQFGYGRDSRQLALGILKLWFCFVTVCIICFSFCFCPTFILHTFTFAKYPVVVERHYQPVQNHLQRNHQKDLCNRGRKCDAYVYNITKAHQQGCCFMQHNPVQ